MTDQHRATPEQWENMEDYRDDGYDDGYASCILELRDRIAALEASLGIGQAATPANTSAPTDSLVERVARTTGKDREYARAAIREVAAWLERGRMLHAAELLEHEAKR